MRIFYLIMLILSVITACYWSFETLNRIVNGWGYGSVGAKRRIWAAFGLSTGIAAAIAFGCLLLGAI